jgi:predicted DNA-binding protein
LERTSAPRLKKARGEHCLNVYVSYGLKERLAALSEKHGLSLADIIRQALKAGIPVFESLTASQDELIDGYVQLLRENRIMGELKK